MSGRDVWAVVSDLHCGSTLGLMPAGGIQLDDGGWYQPSYAQKALWSCWEEYWKTVGEALKPGDRLFVAVNGDATDGDHHSSAQIVSRNMASTQHEIAMACLAPALALDPLRFLMIRGTECHVGQSAQNEERIARDLPCITSDRSGAHSHWHWQGDSHGTLMDFAHHGSVGKMPHTRSNPLKTLAMKIMMASMKHGTPLPNVVYRSHAHQKADTGNEFPVRVIQTPGWQLSTSFVHRIAAGSLPEIGGRIQINEDGHYQIIDIDFPWEREEPCQMRRFVRSA